MRTEDTAKMSAADEPSEIRIRLGGEGAPHEPSDPVLRQLVEEIVRRAYPHARVRVALDLALREDLVMVVGDENGKHAGAIRKLVAYARGRGRRARA